MGSSQGTRRRGTTRAAGTGTRKRKREKTRPLDGRIPGILAVVVAGGVLATILMVLPWRWFAPPTSAFMLRERLTGEAPVRYRWVSRESISPHLAIAVVAAEDQKFPVHFGFDFKSITEALEESPGRRRGASTISQQVVKNLFLWPGRSYLRKGIEAYLTLLVESLWPKHRILEIYLNVAEYGPGIFGAEAASRHFFNKPARQLTLHEASLLAAVLPNPKRMSAGRPSDYVRGRASDIRVWVRKLGGSRYLETL